MPLTKRNPIDINLSEFKDQGVWSVPYAFLLFFIIAFFWTIGQVLGIEIGTMLTPELPDSFKTLLSGDQVKYKEISLHGGTIWAAALFGSIVGIIAIVVAILFKKGSNIKSYLGLFPAKTVDFIKWMGLFILYMMAFEYIAVNSEDFETDFVQNIVSTTNYPWLLIFSVGVIGPIFEELLFRGFLYKSIADSKLGPHAAILITSIIFASTHLQYPIAVVLSIIPMAMILGYARYYSGSIWVPIFLHVFNNTLTTALALYGIELV